MAERKEELIHVLGQNGVLLYMATYGNINYSEIFQDKELEIETFSSCLLVNAKSVTNGIAFMWAKEKSLSFPRMWWLQADTQPGLNSISLCMDLPPPPGPIFV